MTRHLPWLGNAPATRPFLLTLTFSLLLLFPCFPTGPGTGLRTVAKKMAIHPSPEYLKLGYKVHESQCTFLP
ncbi:hypothetical protein EV421DRAFT_171963 [Armillaria borealis]|uniref:Uncharacterized protein n=1 Tax=Armillaria borealis TaxID=47425 RepID=A0AA39IYY2_9AGAR|nr:hypothetical protein EV421DRAFT_171963 [Armillaria borealis]